MDTFHHHIELFASSVVAEVYAYDAALKGLMEYKAEVRVNPPKRTIRDRSTAVIEDADDEIEMAVALRTTLLISRAESASAALRASSAVNHRIMEAESEASLHMTGSATGTVGDSDSPE